MKQITFLLALAFGSSAFAQLEQPVAPVQQGQQKTTPPAKVPPKVSLDAPVTAPSVQPPPLPPILKPGSKRQATLEQPVPGIGIIPGEKGDLLKKNVVRVNSDRTEVVNVSTEFPNRIATPYKNPRFVDTKEAEVQVDGQSLYVIPKTGKPVALYISGDGPNDPVLSLTLIPKNLPPQTIVLQLDNPVGTPAALAANSKEEAPASKAYSDQIRYMLRTVAMGKTPDGFSEGALPRAVARVRDLVVVPESRFSGPYLDIYRYKVTNATQADVEINEESFVTDGVRAVATFPEAVLSPGQSSFLFVISDKSSL